MKKIFKRISAAVMAVCMSAALAASFGGGSVTASASSGLMGDLNGDGRINTTDLLILNKYLQGVCDITRYGAADLDYDGAVTTADLAILNKYAMGIISTLPTTVNNINIPSMDGRTYIMHDYQTNSNSYYYLNGNVDVFSDDGISTYAGNIDDRVTATDTSVVRVSSGGTGFIVAPNVIATAAHCVYNRGMGMFVNNLEIEIRGGVYPNASGEMPTFQVIEAHIPVNYYSNADNNYEYALLYVEEDLSEYGIFDLGLPSDEFMDSNTTVTIVGYPQSVAGSTNNADNKVLYKSNGNILNLNNCQETENRFDYRLINSCYASGGNSGGPLYMTKYSGSNEIHEVIGILTGSGNVRLNGESQTTKTSFCTRITPSLLRFYYNNNFIGSSIE